MGVVPARGRRTRSLGRDYSVVDVEGSGRRTAAVVPRRVHDPVLRLDRAEPGDATRVLDASARRAVGCLRLGPQGVGLLPDTVRQPRWWTQSTSAPSRVSL